ncbi:hypothetical protein [Parasphingorhabdus sp.]
MGDFERISYQKNGRVAVMTAYHEEYRSAFDYQTNVEPGRAVDRFPAGGQMNRRAEISGAA